MENHLIDIVSSQFSNFIKKTTQHTTDTYTPNKPQNNSQIFKLKLLLYTNSNHLQNSTDPFRLELVFLN